jgi:unsaturated pyranuronate lyase
VLVADVECYAVAAWSPRGRAPLRSGDHASVPFVDVDRLPVLEPRPGWRGQFFHSAHMTFAYYAIAADADVHLHEHEEEEVWHVLDGELEVWLAGRTDVLRAGQAFVVPAGEKHAIRALGPSRVIVVDHPVRTSVGGLDEGRSRKSVSAARNRRSVITVIWPRPSRRCKWLWGMSRAVSWKRSRV